jgi:hypothetical protein
LPNHEVVVNRRARTPVGLVALDVDAIVGADSSTRQQYTVINTRHRHGRAGASSIRPSWLLQIGPCVLEVKAITVSLPRSMSKLPVSGRFELTAHTNFPERFSPLRCRNRVALESYVTIGVTAAQSKKTDGL